MALALVVVAAGGAPAVAQPPPAALARGADEWNLVAAVARGVTVLQSRGGQRYVMPSVAWGRVLTDERGPRWMRGRFEWVIEAVPYFAEWAESDARGGGIVPLGWRWNLAARGRWHPFAEVGGGALWTTAAVPAGTTATNFTTHAGAGVRWLGGRSGVIVGYRLHHISNGNRVARNPGVNAHMLIVGWTRVVP
ncbi:MAG: acyloxyacyl hydrolase [Vicinamibacterales bacterium]